MGDLEHIPPFSKGVDSAAAGYSSQPSHPPNPSPSSIKASIWQQAEQETQEIIRYIRPTVVSEQRRKVVVEYVQRLIRVYGSEVFPFGSVPLKTYLPDGDIDLTAISFPNSEDALSSDVRSILEREEHNKDADFEVKDVQYIHAEVRLVKCIVQNIVVDISFNQLGGLCTLCFLEQVDRFIGKDHLFKRSIILIKAWCYYESRILGAHHGLISTYALETLVLYIFHLFHSSLDGPLAVLYRFLDYYSKFDWDKYCISLQGPVFLTSLPDLSVETFDNDGGDLLLTEEFLRNCVNTFSVPVRVSDGNSRTFTKKHLNIVDPLRECNNLGRSVSKGNFYRIRSAFTYGARKLGRLLCLPAESMAVEVNMFFMNTIDRHGGGERPDVQDLVPRSQCSVLLESSGMDIVPVTKLEKEKAEDLSSESPVSKAYCAISNEMKDLRISGLDECEGRIALQNTLLDKQLNSTEAEVNAISSERLTCDAEDLATPRTTVLRSMIDSPKAASSSSSSSSSSSTKENGTLDFRNAYHAPHMFFHPENQTKKDLTLDQINTANLGSSCNVPLNRVFCSDEETINSLRPDSCQNDSSLSSTDRSGNFVSGYPLANHINGLSSILDEMSDLSGEYEVHLNSLSYAVFCQEQIMNTLFVPMPPLSPYSYYHHGKDVWTHGNVFTRPLSPRPPFSSTASYSMNLPYISGSYSTDDASKPRGTGTYFPNTNFHVYRERHSPGRVKSSMSANHLPRHQNNCQVDASQDMGSMEKGSHEPAFQAPLALSGNGRGRFPARMDVTHLSSRPVFRALANASGNVFSPEFGRLEFGSLGPVSVEALPKEHGKRADFPSSHSQASGFANPASSSQKPGINSSRGRTLQSYQLKDDEDFPPLS